MKIVIFTGVKNHCMLHGRVFVMNSCILHEHVFVMVVAFAPKEDTSLHYANTPMQYTATFHGCKNVNFQMKNYNIFLFLL